MTRRGFTMLETLLALALLVILAGGLVAFAWNVNNGRARIVEAARTQSDADAVFAFVAEALHASTLAHGEPVFEAERFVLHARAASDADGTPLPADPFELRFDNATQTCELRRAGAGIGEGIPFGRVRLRYFDGRAWRDQLDASVLPRAVEVALWQRSQTGRPDRVRVLAVPDGGA